MKRITVLALACVAVGANAQTLSGAPGQNNGSGGVFMDLTAINSVTITQIDTVVTAGTGPASIQVWTRPGTYVGFTASNVGWTLHDTVAIGATNGTSFDAIINMIDFTINAGQTTAIYIHSITTGRGIRYNGTNSVPPTVNYSNADLSMFTNTTRLGTVAFAGTQNSPRAFAGTVHYTAVPEPATMAALGLGALAVIRKRRK